MGTAYVFGLSSLPLVIASVGVPFVLALGIVAVGTAIGGVVIIAKREIEARL